MQKLLIVIGVIASAVFAVMPAHAIQIATFGQTSGSNTVVATDNGLQTTINISDAIVDITQLFNNLPINGADFDLTATSIDDATTLGSAVIQHYDGNFCITSGPGCTGINFLSGTFTDAAFGALGGPGLTVNVNNPPDTLTLASDVIPASDLLPPSSFNLDFSNLTPGLAIDNKTIAAFGASFAGNASANAVETTEPASLFIVGIGLTMLGYMRYRKVL